MNMESLRISDDPPGLDTLPDEILLIILSYLTTAQGVSHLASASKRLCRLISTDGWRVFVRNCFHNLSIPPAISPAATSSEWKALARELTSQSRDWDRRAFIFHVFWRQARQSRDWFPNAMVRRTSQTIPCHVMVDVHSQVLGRAEEETIAWGAGEDLVALRRRRYDGRPLWQEWHQRKGTESGFAAGRDDITSLSILKTTQPSQKSASRIAVGRASGDLRLLSLEDGKFGDTIRHFRLFPTVAENDTDQRVVQSLDTHEKTNLLTAATKSHILLYPIDSRESMGLDNYEINGAEIKEPPSVEPRATINIRDVPNSPNFKFIRSLKFLNDETIAVGLASSTEPLRYLNVTPTGIETLAARNISSHQSSDDHRLGTVRALLPIDVNSVASGGKNTILTSWDDGTIRLQDLRTPSAFDRIYQDHFEPTTAISSLVSYGLERFIGGSARAPVLKYFDFRWSRGYYYTEALACADASPSPQPRPPTITARPLVVSRPRCDHPRGLLCRWHALSRESYYRPNCNVYLPKRAGPMDTSVYSLARGSDVSPTLYAGLTGCLVEMGLRTSSLDHPHHHDDHHQGFPSKNASLYSCHRAKVNLFETGDGSALADVSQSQRMPIIRAQTERRCDQLRPASLAKRCRLDEWLQDPSDFSEPQ